MMRLVLLGGRAARLTGAPGRSGHLNGWRPRGQCRPESGGAGCGPTFPGPCGCSERCSGTVRISHVSDGVRVYLGRTTVYDGSNWECYFYHELMKSQDAGKENWRDQ
ncbi:uncharacterized protein LOC103790112 isoform X6 [Callithrix jacchus]